MFRTQNPAMSVFEQVQNGPAPISIDEPRQGVMTINGTITATLILLGVLTASAAVGWSIASTQPALMMPMWIGAAFASLGIFFALKFKPQWAPVLSFVYALTQGVFVGGVSMFFEKMVFTKASGAAVAGTGIVFQALLLTFGILGALLLAYKVKMIRLGGTAQRVIMAATGGIFFLYIAVFALHLIGIKNIPFIHDLFKIQGAGMLGIGFSLFVVVLASLNLVLDFQRIEEAAKAGAPKYMEWYGAYSLLVTLVWLYLEILRLLAKLRGRE